MHGDFDRIDALLASQLPEEERTAVLTHIDTCPTCRAYAQTMAALEGNEPAPVGFAERVMAAVAATAQEKPRRRRPAWRSFAAAAACMLLVAGLLGSRFFPAPDAAYSGTADGEARRSSDDTAADLQSLNEGAGDSQYCTLYGADLCARVRVWLRTAQLSPMSGEAQECYALSPAQAEALSTAIPDITLPQGTLVLILAD